jgi:hypothetical protein
MNGLFVLIATTFMGWGAPALFSQEEERDDKKGKEELVQVEKNLNKEVQNIENRVKISVLKRDYHGFTHAKESLLNLIKHVDSQIWKLRFVFERKSVQKILKPERARLLGLLYSYQKADPILVENLKGKIPPAHKYSDEDNNEILKKVRSSWEHNSPNDVIQEIRIPSNEWKNNTTTFREVNADGTTTIFTRITKRSIPVLVFIKQSDHVVTAYSGSFVKEKTTSYVEGVFKKTPTKDYLISNLK